jgi:hypothetical protein
MRKAFILITTLLLATCIQLMGQAYYNPAAIDLESNGYRNVVFANQPTSVVVTVNNPGSVNVPAGEPIDIMASVNGDAAQTVSSTTLSTSLIGLNTIGGYPTGTRSMQITSGSYLFNTARFGQGAVGGGGVNGVLHDITIWPTKRSTGGGGSSTPVLTFDSMTIQVLYIDAAAFSVTPNTVLGLPSQVQFGQSYSIAVATQNAGIGINTSPVLFWAEIDQYGPVLLGVVAAPVAVNNTTSLSIPAFNLQQLYARNGISLPSNFKYQSHTLRIFAREQGLQNSLDVASFTIPASATLPVSLTSFQGYAEDAGIALTWTTAEEENNQGFLVEKLSASNEFVAIGEVAAKGSNQRYDFRDMEPFARANVYRLRQVDIDGTENILSNQIEVTFEFENQRLSMTAFPNQFKTSFNIQATSPLAGAARLEMLDTKGQKVFSRDLSVEAGVHTYEVHPPQLSPGMYIVRLSTSSQQTSCKVFKF